MLAMFRLAQEPSVDLQTPAGHGCRIRNHSSWALIADNVPIRLKNLQTRCYWNMLKYRFGAIAPKNWAALRPHRGGRCNCLLPCLVKLHWAVWGGISFALWADPHRWQRSDWIQEASNDSQTPTGQRCRIRRRCGNQLDMDTGFANIVHGPSLLAVSRLDSKTLN